MLGELKSYTGFSTGEWAGGVAVSVPLTPALCKGQLYSKKATSKVAKIPMGQRKARVKKRAKRVLRFWFPLRARTRLGLRKRKV